MRKIEIGFSEAHVGLVMGESLMNNLSIWMNTFKNAHI